MKIWENSQNEKFCIIETVECMYKLNEPVVDIFFHSIAFTFILTVRAIMLSIAHELIRYAKLRPVYNKKIVTKWVNNH